MGKVEELMKSADGLGACTQSGKVSDYRSLAWLFFSPQGREFCEQHNFPSLEQFREIKDSVAGLNVFVDSGVIERKNETNIGLIGDTEATLRYTDNEEVHKVILMHGARAKIKASHYAVVLVVNMGNCQVEIEKDKTVVIL